MTPQEIQLARDAIGQLGTDSKTFVRNLKAGGPMTADEALKFFQKALNAKVVLEDRGRVRMTPPPLDPRALSAESIQELEKAGYSVFLAFDGDPPLYGWQHAESGAPDEDLSDRLPLRRTKAQAWVDCKKYCYGDVPSVADPDWVS